MLKRACDVETEGAWFEWKLKLLEPLFASFTENVGRLNRDAGYLDEFGDQIDVMAKIAGEYAESLQEKTAENEKMYVVPLV